MSTIDYIDDLWVKKPTESRYHLGCSEIGHRCNRKLWLSFRHAFTEQFSGRMLRLFRLGQDWEKFFVRDLLDAGVDIVDQDLSFDDGRQLSVDFGYHISGSIDGFINCGLQEMLCEQMIAEFKTHSTKSFDYLVKTGLRRAKPQHFTQCQLYMHGTGLKYAYYLAECKNDCRRWSDIIKYDKKFAEKQLDRAKLITMSPVMPEINYYGPESFDCKYCYARDFCYRFTSKNKIIPNEHCRTCRYSEPKENSTWICAKYEADIPKESQLEEHECFDLHEDII